MPVNLRTSRLGGRPGALSAATGGAGASAFSPADLAGLQLWLSADSGTYTDAARTTPATADGDPVGGWADRSGTAHHASQSTAGSRPALRTNVLGTKPSLRFDGTDDVLQVASAAGLQFTTAATFFAVVDVGVEGVSDTILSKGNTAGDPDWIWDIGVSATEDGKMSCYNGTAFTHGTADIVRMNTFYVLELVWDGATIAFLASGTAGGGAATGTAWATSTEPLFIGEQGSTAVNLLSGDVAELVLYNATLSAGDRTSVRDYLMTKYELPQARQVMYYNGNPNSSLGDYQIGRAVAGPGQTTVFRRTRPSAPVMAQGAGGTWEDDTVKDSFVLYDGGTWKMWYAGFDGTTYQIGYAESSDGITWSKDAGNPVIAVGAGGSFDSNGCTFPIVYKDLAAAAGKRWRMLYSGANGSNVRTIGYAYSADGISWTKGASNPVVSVVPATWESADVIGGCLAKSGSTYYLYYEGKTVTTFPLDAQIGVATFTDFEGTYTKSGSNPILARRTGNQALTADLNSGTTTVTVASTAAFVAGEVVWITNGTGFGGQQVAIATITDATHLEIATVANATYTVAGSSRIQTFLRSVFPRTVYLDGSTWRMWLTPYQVGVTYPESESTYYATSSDPVTGWAYSHSSSPPLALPGLGALNGQWDALASENPQIVFDADTYLPTTSRAV